MTMDFAESLSIDEYGFTILCPYPGCKIYYEFEDKLVDVKWRKTDEYLNDFWHTFTLTNSDLREWQTRFVQRFSDKATWHQDKTHKEEWKDK